MSFQTKLISKLVNLENKLKSVMNLNLPYTKTAISALPSNTLKSFLQIIACLGQIVMKMKNASGKNDTSLIVDSPSNHL